MAEEYNHTQPGLTRQSVLNVEPAETDLASLSRLKILKASDKQTSSLLIGMSLCYHAVYLSTYPYYEEIYEKSTFIEISEINPLPLCLYFVGAFTGSILYGSRRIAWPVRSTNSIAIQMLITACVLLMFPNIIILSIIARFLAGMTFGFIYISLIIQIADNTLAKIRGFVSIYLTICICSGPILGIFFSLFFGSSQWILLVILIIILITTTILDRFVCKPTIEPITRYLLENNEIDAQHYLNKAFGEKFDSSIINAEIDEKKQMLIEDHEGGIFSNGNAWTILRLILLRLLHVLTSNIFIWVVSLLLLGKHNDYRMVHIILCGIQLLFLNLPQYSIDRFGRKKYLLISGLISGAFMLALSKLLAYDLYDYITHLIVIPLLHASVAIGIVPLQPIYAAEAFPLSKRNASLAIVTCVDYVLQGIITFVLSLGEISYVKIILNVSPFLVLILTVVLYFTLPETKDMSMRQCRDAFNKQAKTKTQSPLSSTV